MFFTTGKDAGEGVILLIRIILFYVTHLKIDLSH